MKSRHFGTILYYEIKKIVANRFTLIALIVLAGYSLLQGICQAEQTGDYATRTRELRRAVDGRIIDDELLKEMTDSTDEYGVLWNESNCIYEALADWVRDIVDYGRPLADYRVEDIYEARLDAIYEAMDMQYLTTGEREYWKAKEESLSKPFIWHSADEALGLADIISSTPIIMLLMITLFLSQIFAGEVKDRTDPLLRCTQGGLGLTYGAKITAAVLLTTFLVVFSDAISLTVSYILWGNNGWNAAVQVIMPMSPYNMTMGEMIGRMFIMAFTGSVFLTIVTCFLSECLNNPVAVMGTVFGGFLTILALARQIPLSLRPLSQILYLLSPVDMTSVRGLYELRLIGTGGHYLTAWQFAPLLYLCISAILIVAGRFVYMRKGWS